MSAFPRARDLPDAVLAFCASLRLAVATILLLAGLLAVATFYEARYGVPAVQAQVYSSLWFVGALALLAVNVMAAAVVRYPWKRKQTGFVVTHLGILVLLGGSLLSHRTAVDGHVALRTGETASDFARIEEAVAITLGDGEAARHFSVPGEFWHAAGFPTLGESIYRWWPDPAPRAPNATWTLTDGVTLELLSFLPSARAAIPADGPAAAGTYVATRVNPVRYRETPRAVHVALSVDGVRRTVWLSLAETTATLDTPRGPARLAYGFRAHDLPFALTLLESRRVNNPGTDDPAAFDAKLIVRTDAGDTSRHTLTLNEPLTVGGAVFGYTFYFSKFEQADAGGEAVTVLSVRRDPGTAVKYAGSGLICLGIFLMFYMKAYFAKPASTPTPTPTPAMQSAGGLA